MGETRVDLLHLLEDLRDAYPGPAEETILTEVVANALDSGAATISVVADAAAATVALVDDGQGMRRRDLARYHDLATSTKVRGDGIGFAGVGIKLALLLSREVVTETRRGTKHAATSWALSGRGGARRRTASRSLRCPGDVGLRASRWRSSYEPDCLLVHTPLLRRAARR
jgi:hypothetical protein